MNTQQLPHTATAVFFESPGKVMLDQKPLPKLQKGDFFVQTLYSAISAGTELTFFLGTNPKTSEGWDEQLRLFRGDLEPALGEIYPMVKGYMQSGVVVASKNPKVAVGTHIGAMYGHVAGHVITSRDFWVALPEGFDPLLGVWAAHMGPICLNGVLYAADEVGRAPLTTIKGSLKNQRIIVFGAGMVGLLCGLFATWAGAREVAIVDAISERLETAKQLGLTPFAAHADLPLEVKTHWHSKNPLDTGADIALQCTGSDFLLAEAMSCLREQGMVIDLGFYQQGANQVFFGKEFHHNRLRHICAQIGAVPRQQQPAWNKKRLAEETIAFLADYGELLKQHVITHKLPFSQAQMAFDHLAQRDPAMLQVVLYPDAEP